VILSGGETTVTVRKQPAGTPRGRGGRAGEFCLGLAQALQGQPGRVGAGRRHRRHRRRGGQRRRLRGPDTLERGRAQGMKVDQFLQRNDAYGYFSALGDLVVTGPTHTNVNDFRALLVL
jgi:hydroxypyruvate reductase